MKTILFLIFFTTTLLNAESHYKQRMKNCDNMYLQYRYSYQYAQHNCSDLGKIPKLDLSINEAQDEIDFLEYQQKTLGVACEQIKNDMPLLYKSEYCHLLMNNLLFQQKPQETSNQNIQSNDKRAIPIDPAIQYKNAPQVKMKKLHIYDVKDMEYFRDKKEIIFIKSSIGNFAVPIEELQNAETINFTQELMQKMSMLLQ